MGDSRRVIADKRRLAVDPDDLAPPLQDRRGATLRIMRGVFLVLGLGFVALGFAGIFLPVLPTTPFLILAAACFARSSQRLEGWLLNHQHFGVLLRDWRTRGAIPRKAKWMALGGSALGFTLFWLGSDPGWPQTIAVGLLILSGVLYVFSRPS